MEGQGKTVDRKFSFDKRNRRVDRYVGGRRSFTSAVAFACV